MTNKYSGLDISSELGLLNYGMEHQTKQQDAENIPE